MDSEAWAVWSLNCEMKTIKLETVENVWVKLASVSLLVNKLEH